MKMLETLRGRKSDIPPIWFMRQAGRYLPEYRELRRSCNGFLDLCYSPEKAAEVTLQPVRRFGMDAAILFSDILVLPHALGMEVRFVEGEGPKLTPLAHADDLAKLDLKKIEAHCTPVYETVMNVHASLPKETMLIGFCGAPWTVACYMIEGGGSKEFAKARQTAIREKWFADLMDLLVEGSVDYLLGQIAAGAHTVQVFDSWAGLLPPEEFERWVIAPTREIVARVKAQAPAVPIIGFAKGAGMQLPYYAQATGVDAVGIDFTMPLEWAAKHIPENIVLQGNLDPCLLAADGKKAAAQARKICKAWKDRAFVFNLGHGILPNTPIAHVEAVLAAVRGA